MAEQRENVPEVQEVPKRSWPGAFKAWLKDPEASGIVKFLFFGGSITVLDEWIPFIGQLDDPAIPVWGIIVAYGIYKINKHRDMNYGAYGNSTKLDKD